jgi:hypothetical protein
MRPAPASRFYCAFFNDAGLAVAKVALARILVSHVPTMNLQSNRRRNVSFRR